MINDESDLHQLTQVVNDRIQALVTPYLDEITSPELKAAMQYTLANGGKHLRPLLIYATGLMFNADWESMDLPACSVELIHTYSLIHDDLPCMDNADLRRGQPTCHKIFTNGMAVLAGDALHTLALQILATHPAPLSTHHRLMMIASLTKACGPFGMAAGQALDIIHMNSKRVTKPLLETIHRLKTGKLFSACMELGYLSSREEKEKIKQILIRFGDLVGLAFQIQDDIFDIEVTTAELGKPQGCDNKNNKLTYPQIIGLPAAKSMVESLYEQALTELSYFGKQANILQKLTQHMYMRKK